MIEPGTQGMGEPTSQEDLETLRCLLISTLPEQLGEQCERTADMHVLARHPEDGSLRRMHTCLRHYTTALEVGEKVAAHQIGLWCELPSTTFDPDLNRCVPDDRGEEL